MTHFSLLAAVREILFPAGCAICGVSLLDRGHVHYGLCPLCLASLRSDPAPRCRLCGRPLLSEEGLCMRCRLLEDPPSIQWSCALYSYASSARSIVRAWKFGRHSMLTHFVARSLVRPVLRILLAFPGRNFVIVPAPSSPGRWKRTGHEPLLSAARELSRRTGLPLASVLVRDCSRSQKTLDRKGREANLRGKLRCIKEAAPHVILIDDVITTGATLRSCARALLAAGTETLCCLTFCYD